MSAHAYAHTVDCEIFVVKILIPKVWQRKLGYAKNLQAKYFTGKNIPIYGSYNNSRVPPTTSWKVTRAIGEIKFVCTNIKYEPWAKF